MTTFDFTPLWRSTVGFDRLFDLLGSNLQEAEGKYPPYDIVRTGDDTFRISLAIAGFDPSEVQVTEHQNVLTVSGRKEGRANGGEYLYRGISGRAFERRFTLSDHVVVKGASFDNGMLQIDLQREVPESAKPRRIEIAGSPSSQNVGAPPNGKVIDHPSKAA